MTEEFEDVLDRYDFDWYDLQSSDSDAIREQLRNALGMSPAGKQMDIATAMIARRQEQLTDLGYSVGTFQRGGQAVQQMRDARGRFVTSGLQNISARLGEESG
jgi:hypothetical protein